MRSVRSTSTSAVKQMSAFDRQAVGARGAGYGLDAELARKREAGYDHRAEDEVRAWIEAITQEPCEGPFGESLRNGVLLCKLVNCISPGSVKKINESRMPFKQMENISNFLKACRTLGVAEHSLFETVDLFENKDLGLVVRCVFALGSTVQVACPEFQGPHLGAKISQTNKRVFNDKQKQQARINSSFSKMNMGSAHSMERAQVFARGITFGAENAGPGDTTVLAKLSQGSHGFIERLPVDRSKSITFGAETVGMGDSKVLTKASLGSYGIMERAVVSKRGITFGADNSQMESSTVPVTPVKAEAPTNKRLDDIKTVLTATECVDAAAAAAAVVTADVLAAPKTVTDQVDEAFEKLDVVVLDDIPAPSQTASKFPVSSTSVDQITKSWFQARSG